jgi:hypothetical protein
MTLNTPGPGLWGMVLTDRRTIFVHLYTDWWMYGFVAGLAPAVAAALAGKKEPWGLYEYWDVNPDALSATPKSIVIEHASVTEWRLRKRAFDDAYRIYFFCNEGGKKKKLYGTIKWTAEVPQRPTGSDPTRRATCRRQAEAIQRAFAQVLPQSAMACFQGIE